MRKIFFITTLLWLANVNAQFFIGIPFLDRCRNMSKCDLCNPKSPKTIEYLDSLDVLLKNAIVNDENLSALNQLKIIDDEIVRYNSMYAKHQPDLTVAPSNPTPFLNAVSLNGGTTGRIQLPSNGFNDFTNGLSAGVWQAVAFVFGSSLKQQYDPSGDDQELEKIVKEVQKLYGYRG